MPIRARHGPRDTPHRCDMGGMYFGSQGEDKWLPEAGVLLELYAVGGGTVFITAVSVLGTEAVLELTLCRYLSRMFR